MILYVETSFLVGAAMGRDPSSHELLRLPSEQCRTCIPSVCVMEAWSAYESERNHRNRFAAEVDSQVRQARRDTSSEHARSLVTHLEQARSDAADLLNEIRDVTGADGEGEEFLGIESDAQLAGAVGAL